MDRERRAAERLRPDDAHLRILVRQHQRRAAELDLGMADAAARLGQPEQLLGAECALVELQRLRRAADAQIRIHLVHVE
jgi:hypothetical protein